MFAIAFDLVVADTARNHPKGVSQAYADIGGTLANFGFNRVQGRYARRSRNRFSFSCAVRSE
jgi:virulence-associated protein VapD